MLNLLRATRVYLAAGATDLRKSFDTLTGVVRGSLRLDPLSGHGALDEARDAGCRQG